MHGYSLYKWANTFFHNEIIISTHRSLAFYKNEVIFMSLDFSLCQLRVMNFLLKR